MIVPLSIETRPNYRRSGVDHTEDRTLESAVRAEVSQEDAHVQSIKYLNAGPRAGRADWRGLMLKTAVVLPEVIISSLIGLVVIAALPSVIGLCITAAWLAASAVLAAGLGEAEAVRILYGARRATPAEVARLVIPGLIVAERVDTSGVRVRIVTHGHAVSTFGRRHVLLAQEVVQAFSAGKIADVEVAALLIQGIGRLRLGHSRFDLLWGFWSAPWDFIRGMFAGAGRQLAWVPLGRFAWKTRFIVGAIAVILEALAGRWPSPIVITGFIALSYLMPHWRESWEDELANAVDRCVNRSARTTLLDSTSASHLARLQSMGVEEFLPDENEMQKRRAAADAFRRAADAERSLSARLSRDVIEMVGELPGLIGRRCGPPRRYCDGGLSGCDPISGRLASKVPDGWPISMHRPHWVGVDGNFYAITETYRRPLIGRGRREVEAMRRMTPRDVAQWWWGVSDEISGGRSCYLVDGKILASDEQGDTGSKYYPELDMAREVERLLD